MTDTTSLLEQFLQVVQTHQAETSPPNDISGGKQIKVTCSEKTVTVSLYFKKGLGLVQPRGAIAWVDEWVDALPKNSTSADSPTDSTTSGEATASANHTLWLSSIQSHRDSAVKKITELFPHGSWTREDLFKSTGLTITLYEEKLLIQGRQPQIPALKQQLIQLQQEITLSQIQEIPTSSAAIANDRWEDFCHALEAVGYHLSSEEDRVLCRACEDCEDEFTIGSEDLPNLARFREQGAYRTLISADAECLSEIQEIFSQFCSDEKGKILGISKTDSSHLHTWVIAVHPQLFAWLQSQPSGGIDPQQMLPLLQEHQLCSEIFTRSEPHSKDDHGWKKIRQMWDADMDRLRSDPKNPIQQWDAQHLGVPDKIETRNLSAFANSNAPEANYFVLKSEDSSLRSFMDRMTEITRHRSEEVV